MADSDRRDAIARRGFERVSREHTYDRRFDELLGVLIRQSALRPRKPIDWREFEAAARRHTVGPILMTVRSVIVMWAKLIWGAHRGPRAARRIAFELSWRFFGSHTYTAAGWPGRMFYKES